MPDPTKPGFPASNALHSGVPEPPPPQPLKPVKDLPPATRAGSKPHLHPDAKFRVHHACALSCYPGEKNVPRDRFRPQAAPSGEAGDKAHNEVIERLMKLGAISQMSQHELDAEEEELTKPA